MKTSNWANPGKPGYRIKQEPVGKDRKQNEGPFPSNNDLPQTWTHIMGNKIILCAADILQFDPTKRKLKTPSAQPKSVSPEPHPEKDPYNAITMKVDYALGDLAEARNMAREAGEDALAARIESAIRKAFAELREAY